MRMWGIRGIDERRVWSALGLVYKALILGTLGTLFVFAPLKNGSRFPANSPQVAMTRVQEIPEVRGSQKVLWLSPKKLSRGQGGQL